MDAGSGRDRSARRTVTTVSRAKQESHYNAPILGHLYSGRLFTGLAAVLAVAQLGQANTTIADGRMFMTVTAVVVGGTALTGGWGGVGNSLVGVLIVQVLANGMVLLGVSPYVHEAVQGLMIIAAVALSIRRGGSLMIK